MAKIREHENYRNAKKSKDGSISARIRDPELADDVKEYCKRNNTLVSLFVERACDLYLEDMLENEKQKKVNEFIDKITKTCSEMERQQIIERLQMEG